MITCNEQELQDKIFKTLDNIADGNVKDIIKILVQEAIVQNDLVALTNILKVK